MEVVLKLSDPASIPRQGYVVEQGIPVPPMDPAGIAQLALVDEDGAVVPAYIEHDGRDENGDTVWLRMTTALDLAAGSDRRLKLISSGTPPPSPPGLILAQTGDTVSIRSPFCLLTAGPPGFLTISTDHGPVIEGEVRFQLWPDARSIIGAGAGTNRLAAFEPDGWAVEEPGHSRCLLVLRGHVPKYAAYTTDPSDLDPTARFDCELELIINAFSPAIRYRWRIENQTHWLAYLERYALVMPLAQGSRLLEGEGSDDGKFLSWVSAETPGGPVAFTASYIEALGDGAGINIESRLDLGGVSPDEIALAAAGGVFEPHRFLAAIAGHSPAMDIISGGINPPQDATMWAENPQVHRLFYRGMSRTFDGAIIVGASPEAVQAELYPVYFELPPDYYSEAGALPENGDPVEFGEFRDQVFACAEWMLARQWRGTLWWGEWWREWDIHRKQGVESTANGNNPLGPLYHYWRTGDSRFVQCAKRAMEFVCDIQLNNQKAGLAPFFHSRRFLIDQMEWVHMRYQRIEGPMKTAHFLGDRRARTRVINAMRRYANALVLPNGAPGYAEGGPLKGKAVAAGSDCTNFGEVLGICYRETGEQQFLDKAIKMADWTLRQMRKWDWDEYVGNSYGWHFLMRGMLSTLKLTGKKRYRDWYVDLARRNLTYPLEQIEFRCWMDWLLVEAEKMSGEAWFLEEIRDRTRIVLKHHTPDGAILDKCEYPWSKWPSVWQRLYDQKTVIAYVPVLTARLAAVEGNSPASEAV